MPQYIAFLRAINVGGRTVAMDRLRRHFEEMGLAGVATFIASGNVVFTSRARNPDVLERRIATHLHAALGFTVDTFVRAPGDLRRILDAVPFAEADVAAAHAVMVGLLGAAPDRDTIARVAALSGAADELRVIGRELYWLRRAPESDPALGRALERAIGTPMTVRNATTLRRLRAKYADPAPSD